MNEMPKCFGKWELRDYIPEGEYYPEEIDCADMCDYGDECRRHTPHKHVFDCFTGDGDEYSVVAECSICGETKVILMEAPE